MSTPTEKRVSKRTGNRPWKGIYGVDRKYTARVDRARARRAADLVADIQQAATGGPDFTALK